MTTKFWIVFQYEFLKRITNKTFIVMTLLAPILFAVIATVPALVAVFSESESFTIRVIDPSGKILPELKKVSEPNLTFQDPISSDLESQKSELLKNKNLGILTVSEDLSKRDLNFVFHSATSPTIKMESNLEKKLGKIVARLKLEATGLNKSQIESTEYKILLSSKKITEKGEESGSSILGYIYGYSMGLLCFMMVFIYGSILMKGVIEEKSNRIVEVIISSVKPMDLMMGKIVGIGAVGLAQFAAWIISIVILTLLIGIIFGQSFPMDESINMHTQVSGMSTVQSSIASEEIFNAIKHFKISILFFFIYYFLGGYLIYGALFAAIGAAIDQEADAGPLTTIISIPAYIPILIMPAVMNNPNGSLAFWTSIFPFTSSTIMLARMALMDVPIWEIMLSMVSLILGVLGVAWVAARIYRVGILLYGKKITFSELSKWVLLK